MVLQLKFIVEGLNYLLLVNEFFHQSADRLRPLHQHSLLHTPTLRVMLSHARLCVCLKGTAFFGIFKHKKGLYKK